MSNVIELKSRLYEIFLQEGEDHVENGHFDPGNGKLYFFRGNAYQRLTQGEKGWEDLKTAARLGDHLVQEYLMLSGITWDASADVSWW